VSSRVEDVKELMAAAEKAFEAIDSYRCVIHCHEQFKKLRKPESIFSYFKKPNSVYLRWQRGPHEGLQSSHVPHRDGPNKFQARESGIKGLAGAMTFPNDSPIIDKAYPHHFKTHETSVQHLLQLTNKIQKRAEELGKYSVIELIEVDDPLLKRRTTKAVSRLSDRPSDGLQWLRTEFYFELDTELPLHFKLFGFDGEMIGEYAFTDFTPNVTLTDDDFVLKKL
jgi:hypothetical protein